MSPVEQILRKIVWSFAASAATTEAVEPALRESLGEAVKDATDTQVAQMFAASKATTRLAQSRLWGSGPFSLALSGTDHSFYISVIGDG